MIHSIDRPTNNTLVYLTKVRPHKIIRDTQLKDPYVEQSLTDLIGSDSMLHFKEYTRSYYTLEGHYCNLWLYDRPFYPQINDPLFDIAIQLTSEAFRLPNKVNSISWDALNTVPFIGSSGAGWGYIGKKGDRDNHRLAISRAVGHFRSWNEKQPSWRYTPDLAWTRTQLGTFDRPKIRNVWGKAFHNIILEGISAYPLIAAYQDWESSPMVVGIHLYKRLPNVIHNILNMGDEPLIGVGIDFKGFDTTPQPWLIDLAFNILEENINFTDLEGKLAYDYSKEFFINTPVIMPDGRMWLKKLGVPSGSYFTQLIDSVINHIVITYIQLKVWKTHFPTKVLGDDSAFGIPYHYGWPDLDKISRVASLLDFTVHPDKIVVATRPDQMEFLGHVARGTRVDRDTAKMLRLALFPEYPVDSPELSISRMKGLLVDSALNNWPIVNLLKYMEVKYQSTGGVKFSHDDRNWLEGVVRLNLTPNELNLVSAWTLT